MVRKILSDLLSGLRADFVSGARDGIAWGLAMSPPNHLTALLEPLAADHAPHHSLPPSCEVVVLPTPTEHAIVSRGRDGVASMLFLAWHWEMRLRSGLAQRRLAARTSAHHQRHQLYAVRGGR